MLLFSAPFFDFRTQKFVIFYICVKSLTRKLLHSILVRREGLQRLKQLPQAFLQKMVGSVKYCWDNPDSDFHNNYQKLIRS